MASSLAAQLAQISANSRTTLNSKALKATHSKSLIFEPRVAASQTFAEIYKICSGGYEELCHLDPRFAQFRSSIWNEQSQEADRTQMSKEENAVLDRHVEAFLHLCGSRLRLMPAIKAIEWLIRRFRIHEFNTAVLITTFLPYHTIPAFVTLLSILPSDIPKEYRFLDPYIKSCTAPPRAAIVQQATNSPDLLSAISQYTLTSCRAKQEYPGLVSFWAGIMVEATNGMLDKMRSGRKSIQAQNNHALLQQIGPVLSEALVMRSVPGLQIASYMVAAILASKAGLDDAAVSAFMDQIVHGWTVETLRPGLVSLCILAQFRSAKQLPARMAKSLQKVPNLVSTLIEINKEYRADMLANGLAIALVERLRHKGDSRSLHMVSSLLVGELLQEKQVRVVYKALIVAAHSIDDKIDEDGHLRKELGSSLVALSQAGGEAGDFIRAAIEETDLDIEELELRLGTSIRPKLAIEEANSDAMAVDSNPRPKTQHIEPDFDKLSTLSPPQSSCLSGASSSVVDDLCSFLLLVASSEDNVKKFDEAPVLSRTLAPRDTFYFSFYMRFWCGQFPTLAKVVALQRVKSRLKEEDCVAQDFQALIPYCIIALSDPAKKVRRAAADLMTVLGQFYTAESGPKRQVWGSQDLYEKADDFKGLDFDTTKTLLHSVILPSLEESVIHQDHILTALTSSLEGSKASELEKKPRLSHAMRLSVLKFLSSHILATPLLVVKLRLLTSLNRVRSSSGTSRTELLLPVLRWWASVPQKEAHLLAGQESVDEQALDNACVDVVVAGSQPGLKVLLGLIKNPDFVTRPGLVQSIFSRLAKLWPSMKADVKFSTAQDMFALSQNGLKPGSSETLIAVEATEFLRQVELSTDILGDLLESLQGQVKLVTEQPAVKSRRVSTSEPNRPANIQTSAEAKAAVNQATFVLELVQASNPAQHPELLPSLFGVLSDLIHLRTLIGSELGYLQNSVLSSLLAMIPAFKDNKSLTIDPSVGYGDVLATCIQKSSNPAVINAALLLVASLARTAPEVVLHSVMPIFTFMGSSVLKQADDYSAIVVNQTIREVIPPLIDTFRKSRRNLVASTAELLASFVISFEHIPSHRKHDLFISLIENLGPVDFLFAVIAMFVDRYGVTDNIVTFTTQIMASFSVQVQLETLVKFLDLISDIFKPKPVLSNALLARSENADRDPQKLALKQLSILPGLLANGRLKREIAQLAGRDDMESAKVHELYATLLENLLTLAGSVKSMKVLYLRAGDALSNLLNLLPIASFIKTVETLLDRPNVSLRQKVLRALEMRVDRESTADADSRTALLSFLPQLTAVIRESDDMNYKHTAVTCVDKIAEKYGKKDLEAVAAAAATIAGDHCLGQCVQSLRVMALVCLASLVDVLQDSIVPVLPVAIPRTLTYLEETLAGEKPDTNLHNAAYAFMSALAQHIPYMISGAYLDRLLACSGASAAAGLDNEANENRTQCLGFIARLVEAKVLYTALNQNWKWAVNYGYPALVEYVDILSVALAKHSKSDIAKNMSIISTTALNVLDWRRLVFAKGHVFENQQLLDLRKLISDCLMHLVYKLNDAAFRPMFSHLVEWSATGADLPKQDKAGRTRRQLGVYGFILTLFRTLGSIVTGYASYVVDDAVRILRETDHNDWNEHLLWRTVLKALMASFEFDKDGFWQAPAHFGAVAPLLVDQFLLAPGNAGAYASLNPSTSNNNNNNNPENSSSSPLTNILVPALVEFASATDSKEHNKELNGALLKLLRTDQAQVTVLVLMCQQELTARLGEKWLQNLPEMLPYISELQDDDDETVRRENNRWTVEIEKTLGESLDSMLQ